MTYNLKDPKLWKEIENYSPKGKSLKAALKMQAKLLKIKNQMIDEYLAKRSFRKK